MPAAWQIAYSRFEVGYGCAPDLTDQCDSITFVQLVQEAIAEERNKAADDELNALVDKVLAKAEDRLIEKIAARVEKQVAEGLQAALKDA